MLQKILRIRRRRKFFHSGKRCLNLFFLVNLFFDPRIIATCSTSCMMMVLMVNWINSRCFNVIHFWAHFLFFSCYFSPSHCIIFLSTIKWENVRARRARKMKNSNCETLSVFFYSRLLASQRNSTGFRVHIRRSFLWCYEVIRQNVLDYAWA